VLKKIIPFVWLLFAVFGIWKGGVLADNVTLKRSEGVLNSSQINLINRENVDGYQIIDIRSREKYSIDYIYGSVNISSDQLLSYHAQLLNKDISYIVTSDDLRELSNVVRFLRNEGYSVFFHEGGLQNWKEEGFPTFAKL
jgi:rhodanese-related sulfurtransferase